MTLARALLPSPVGTLTLVASERGLAAILWEDDRPERGPLAEAAEATDHPILRAAAQQLDEYFAGTRTTFALALDMDGTPFQHRVWAALKTIPYGQTRSYGEIARQIGAPGAARAVGSANNRNPVPIVVPCHRVIGAAGDLTGFAGGMQAKAFLLGLEGRQRQLAL